MNIDDALSVDIRTATQLEVYAALQVLRNHLVGRGWILHDGIKTRDADRDLRIAYAVLASAYEGDSWIVPLAPVNCEYTAIKTPYSCGDRSVYATACGRITRSPYPLQGGECFCCYREITIKREEG